MTKRGDQHFILYDGKVEIRYNGDNGKHLYHVRPLVPGFQLNEAPDLPPGGEWLYTPSVTAITRMLGGGKIDGLLYWAVNQTLEHLDRKLEDDLIVPSVEHLLDCFSQRLQAAIGDKSTVSVSVVEGVMNSLDNCVGMSEPVWKALRATAATARDRRLDEASDLGNMVHDWLEGCILSRLGLAEQPDPPSNLIAQRAIKRWLAWEDKNQVKWHLTEQRVYSNKWHYTGTLDALAELNGVLTLVDFKTSKKVYDEHRFQTAAYVKALEEELNIDIPQRMVMRLSKTTGSVTPTILENQGQFTIDDDFAAFIGLRGVYRRLKGA